MPYNHYYDSVTGEHWYKGHWTSNYWNEKAEFEALEDIYKELEYDAMLEEREWLETVRRSDGE